MKFQRRGTVYDFGEGAKCNITGCGQDADAATWWCLPEQVEGVTLLCKTHLVEVSTADITRETLYPLPD